MWTDGCISFLGQHVALWNAAEFIIKNIYVGHVVYRESIATMGTVNSARFTNIFLVCVTTKGLYIFHRQWDGLFAGGIVHPGLLGDDIVALAVSCTRNHWYEDTVIATYQPNVSLGHNCIEHSVCLHKGPIWGGILAVSGKVIGLAVQPDCVRVAENVRLADLGYDFEDSADENALETFICDYGVPSAAMNFGLSALCEDGRLADQFLFGNNGTIGLAIVRRAGSSGIGIVCDLNERRVLTRFLHSNDARVSLSDNGHFVSFVDPAGDACVLHIHTGQQLKFGPARQCLLSYDGSRLMIAEDMFPIDPKMFQTLFFKSKILFLDRLPPEAQQGVFMLH
jgi:hypothetical protein